MAGKKDQAKPEATELAEKDLDRAQGGITLDNGLKQHGVVVRENSGSFNTGMPPSKK